MPSAFLTLMIGELVRARVKHPEGIHSPHEGYGVIAEEVAEFFDEVRLWRCSVGYHTTNKESMLKELVQIAAMCQRTAEDRGLSPGEGARIMDQESTIGTIDGIPIPWDSVQDEGEEPA